MSGQEEITGHDAVQASATLPWALHHFVVSAAELDVSLAARLGLSPSEYVAMKHLMTSEVPLGPGELGTLIGLTSGPATGLVDRLERAGHLERHRDPHDRRRLILKPTDSAVTQAMRALQPLSDAVQELAETFTAEEGAAIERFLREATALHRSFSRGRNG